MAGHTRGKIAPCDRLVIDRLRGRLRQLADAARAGDAVRSLRPRLEATQGYLVSTGDAGPVSAPLEPHEGGIDVVEVLPGLPQHGM